MRTATSTAARLTTRRGRKGRAGVHSIRPRAAWAARPPLHARPLLARAAALRQQPPTSAARASWQQSAVLGASSCSAAAPPGSAAAMRQPRVAFRRRRQRPPVTSPDPPTPAQLSGRAPPRRPRSSFGAAGGPAAVERSPPPPRQRLLGASSWGLPAGREPRGIWRAPRGCSRGGSPRRRPLSARARSGGVAGVPTRPLKLQGCAASVRALGVPFAPLLASLFTNPSLRPSVALEWSSCLLPPLYISQTSNNKQPTLDTARWRVLKTINPPAFGTITPRLCWRRWFAGGSGVNGGTRSCSCVPFLYKRLSAVPYRLLCPIYRFRFWCWTATRSCTCIAQVSYQCTAILNSYHGCFSLGFELDCICCLPIRICHHGCCFGLFPSVPVSACACIGIRPSRGPVRLLVRVHCVCSASVFAPIRMHSCAVSFCRARA